jgi:hypothetical protein
MLKNQYEKQIYDLFEDFYFLNSKEPILVGKLPEPLLKELEYFTEKCKEIKEHPLYFLKNHVNVGRNKFQVSVPTNVFEDSFLFAFLIHMGEYCIYKVDGDKIEKVNRLLKIRKNQNHFDGYDFWINFIEPGDINAWHNHVGTISGVIYFDNDIGLPTKFKDGSSFQGTKGDIIMFPSHLEHCVEKNTTDKTRITYAFNLTV